MASLCWFVLVPTFFACHILPILKKAGYAGWTIDSFLSSVPFRDLFSQKSYLIIAEPSLSLLYFWRNGLRIRIWCLHISLSQRSLNTFSDISVNALVLEEETCCSVLPSPPFNGEESGKGISQMCQGCNNLWTGIVNLQMYRFISWINVKNVWVKKTH